MKKIALISGVSLLLPFMASAQADATEAVGFLDAIQVFIAAALPVILSLAVLLFLWGLVKYMTNADDPEARASSRGLMIWGVVIIFVMISLWGLVNFIASLTGLDSTTVGAPPLLP